MDKVTVQIGETTVQSDFREDNLRPVEFTGECLGQVTIHWDDDRSGGLDQNRGATQTLYLAEDGRLLVHEDRWSRWQGEPNEQFLYLVGAADLGTNGQYERLGRACGYAVALTLDEALEQ